MIRKFTLYITYRPLLAVSLMCALAVFITPHSCLSPVQSCTEAPCISLYTGAKSTVGTLKPDRAFNVHKLLISSFILGHGVYERQCYKDCKLPCIFFIFYFLGPSHCNSCFIPPRETAEQIWPIKPIDPGLWHTRHKQHFCTFYCLHGRLVLLHL